MKLQHIPLSVGMVLKMAEHGIVLPFQEQDFSMALELLVVSKHGSWVLHNISNKYLVIKYMYVKLKDRMVPPSYL